MMDARQDSPEDDSPLDSWKEIAAYLQRDVRTLMRWEKHEGLPVRRHHHQLRSSVYAYPRELDAWRAARTPEPEVRPAWRRPLPATGLAFALLLPLVSAGGSGRPGDVEAADGIAMRQVWSGADVTTNGAPSPNGRFLTFLDMSNGDLAVRDLTTGENRRLTRKEGGWDNWHEYAGPSVISPDGKRVAFAWSNREDHGELRVVNMDGSEERVLYRTEHAYDAIEPADWSRDGTLVLARHMVEKGRDRLYRIVTVALADGSLTVLKTLDWRSADEMRFSPDGRFVVYDFPEESTANTDIFVLGVSDGRVVPLVQHAARDQLAGWSPDGRWVLFMSDRTPGWGLWRVPVSDGRAEGPSVAVKRNTGPIIPLGFTEAGAFYYGTSDGGSSIYLSTPGGGTPSLLASQFFGAGVGPSWSPDGRKIAYVLRATSPRAKIFVRTVATAEEREYSPDLAWFVVPLLWSPDGRSLLVRGQGPDGKTGSYRIDLGTGRVEPVLLEPRTGISAARWSADGKAIYYIERATGEPGQPSARLVRRDVATGRDETVAVPPEGISFTRVVCPSPDGKDLALWVQRGGQGRLAVMPASGGRLRELTDAWEDAELDSIAWTPDSQQIYCIRREGTFANVTRSELWAVPLNGGEPVRPGFSTMGRLARFSIHPDGKQMVFSLAERASEVWVMESFLPGAPGAGR